MFVKHVAKVDHFLQKDPWCALDMASEYADRHFAQPIDVAVGQPQFRPPGKSATVDLPNFSRYLEQSLQIEAAQRQQWLTD